MAVGVSNVLRPRNYQAYSTTREDTLQRWNPVEYRCHLIQQGILPERFITRSGGGSSSPRDEVGAWQLGGHSIGPHRFKVAIDPH